MSHPAVQFSKYHGTGNDFVIVSLDAFERARLQEIVPQLCDRNRGIGADGVIVVDPTSADEVAMQIYNRDGSRPQMCGNGVRCVARHMVEQHGYPSLLTVLSDAGPRACTTFDGAMFEVEVDMGAAALGEVVVHRSAGVEWVLHSVDMGNPHGVVWVDAQPPLEVVDAVGAALNGVGSPYRDGVNVEFTRQISSTSFEVVVYERGVGRTQACGTGACAVAAAAWHTGRAEGEVMIELPGGVLKIRRGEDRVWMRGEAELVMQGDLPASWLRRRLS